jgi:hypothetical protein
MAFDNARAEFDREPFIIVEIDADFCDLVAGVAPCEATETGDDKCFNTYTTCNDVPNFDKITKTYRFCEPRSPHPFGLNAMPLVRNVSVAPAQIDHEGGLGVRSQVTITLGDFSSADLDGVDPYLDDRTYIATDRGTFWSKWRARNKYYEGRGLRVLSGYLINGEYDASNFTVRHYIIDKLDAATGTCQITGKDPLKLASSLKAVCPQPSKGVLLSSLTDSAASFTLSPTGIGDIEYPASGYVRIKSEVMSFTRSGDAMTVVRARYNTTAKSASANDTVQLCVLYNDTVDVIVEDLLTTYANIDAAYIPSATWALEVDTYLAGNYDALITTPTGVGALLKELGEQAPHTLYWDERTQKIVLTATKAPPDSATCYTEDEIVGEIDVKDLPDKRISTVIVYFGQVDPTKSLTEENNWASTHARFNSDSIVRYGDNKIKTVYARWIESTNKAAALRMAARIGRRFGDAPREFSFSLDAKDGSLWAGNNARICHRDAAVDFTGEAAPVSIQIISAKESDVYQYKALEHIWDVSLTEDEGEADLGTFLIIIAATELNVDLYDIFVDRYGTPDSETVVKFIVDGSGAIGSSSNATYALTTGAWPEGALVTLQINAGGVIAGKGGDSINNANGGNGGSAILIENEIEIINNGIIGAGGGGGGYAYDIDGFFTAAIAQGGGGAGVSVGLRTSISSASNVGSPIIVEAQNGSTTSGGAGADVKLGGAHAIAGAGGGLGQSGANGVKGDIKKNGGSPGAYAINENGFTVTYTVTGDIRGTVA